MSHTPEAVAEPDDDDADGVEDDGAVEDGDGETDADEVDDADDVGDADEPASASDDDPQALNDPVSSSAVVQAIAVRIATWPGVPGRGDGLMPDGAPLPYWETIIIFLPLRSTPTLLSLTCNRVVASLYLKHRWNRGGCRKRELADELRDRLRNCAHHIACDNRLPGIMTGIALADAVDFGRTPPAL